MIPHNHNRKARRPRMVSIRSKQPRGFMSRSNIGKEISREDALEVAAQVLVDAEKNRLDFAKEEAQRGEIS